MGHGCGSCGRRPDQRRTAGPGDGTTWRFRAGRQAQRCPFAGVIAPAEGQRWAARQPEDQLQADRPGSTRKSRTHGTSMLLGRAAQPQRWPMDVVPAATMAHRCGYPPPARQHPWPIVAVRRADLPASQPPPAANRNDGPANRSGPARVGQRTRGRGPVRVICRLIAATEKSRYADVPSRSVASSTPVPQSDRRRM